MFTRLSLQIIMIPLLMMSSVFSFTVTATETAEIYVSLPQTIVLKEEICSVNISITNVADLCGWQFKLYYNNLILNGTSITEGSFLKSGGNTYFYLANFTDTYNATHGCVWALCTLFAPDGVNGEGDLAEISFKAKRLGKTSLNLTDTIIVDSAYPPNEIPHVAIDGLVTVTGLGDFDVDGDVDAEDRIYMVIAYRTYWQTGEIIDSRCDFNQDGIINSEDRITLVRAYREYWYGSS